MITPALAFWWRLLATLAVEVCCLAALGFAAQWLARSAFWRRAAWQITVVCLLAAAVSEWTGVGRALAEHFAPGQPALENTPTLNFLPAPRENPVEVPFAALPPPPERPARAVWWPGLIGLAGTALLLGRTALAQGLLLALRFGRNKITDGPLRERLARLSPCLGLRRKIGLRRMSALVSPMAFGVLRPCIGLPAQFETRFSPAEQDAVLAHELAHLAARDPLWFLLADLAVAALWWHPAAWWARQRLHVISEQAADQATAFVPDGPKALARCLVALGKEMADMGAWGWVGINGGGFRSILGRRVEGLLQLSDGPPPRLLGRGARAAKIAALLAAAPLTVLAFGSMQTTQGQSDETWRSQLQQSWRQSPAGVLLMAKRDDQAEAPTTNQLKDATPPKDEDNKPHQKMSSAMETHQIENAKIHYEMGQYDEAETIFKQIQKDDPSNRAAPYYLDLIKEVRYMEYARAREAWEKSSQSGVAPVPYPMADTNLVYFAKIFHVNPNTFIQALQTACASTNTNGGIHAPVLPSKGAGRLQMIGEATNSSQTVRKMIQSYFTALGLDLSPPKVILLNKRVGELYVRATLSDLQLIQKAVERLNHSPAQQPSEEDVQRLQEIEKKKREVAPLVQEGKLLYEMGQFDQAEKIFVQVVKDDPSNGSAPYFLDLIKEARYMQRADELHPRPPARQRESLRHPNPMPDTNVVNITKGRQRILAKLDTIMFDEVSYDLPLKDVLARLQKKSQKRDPDGEGVNFMLVNPIAAVPTQQQDIGADVRIRISPALSKVRLEDVLQAITKSADKPIRYTIEDYGVVFWPK